MSRTLQAKLNDLRSRDASRDHLLKDGYRYLDAAEVAYLMGFRDYRNAYREPIERGPRGWLARDVKRHMDRGRALPTTAAQASRARAHTRASNDAPLWGGDAA